MKFVNHFFLGLCSFDSVTCSGTLCNPQICVGPTQGCTITNFVDSCNDNNACTIESCDSSSGKATCSFTILDCDDNNNCTTDLCDPTIGCHHQNISCLLIF